jgi:hypothetical protein
MILVAKKYRKEGCQRSKINKPCGMLYGIISKRYGQELSLFAVPFQVKQ